MAERKPWSVKGIDTRARAVALEAARAEGVTLGDYINKLLLETSEGDSVQGESGLFRKDRMPNAHISTTTNNASNTAIIATDMTLDTQKNSADTDELHQNLDLLTNKIEAVEGRSTLAITGIDKSLMGLIARIESIESGQNDTSEHVSTVLEVVQDSQDKLKQQIKTLKSDDSSKKNLDFIRSMEKALGKLAAEMYSRQEAQEDQNQSIDERLAAMDRRNAEFMGKIRMSEERLTSAFEAHTVNLDDALAQKTSEHEHRLQGNENRQRQALAEAESRQRTHLSEMEARIEEKVDVTLSKAKTGIEDQLNAQLENLRAEITNDIDSSIHAQSETITQLAQRQDNLLETAEKSNDAIDDRLRKIEDITETRFEGLKETTIKTLESISGTVNGFKGEMQQVETKFNAFGDALSQNMQRVDAQFKGQGIAIDKQAQQSAEKHKAQGVALDDAVTAIGDVADTVGSLTKRAAEAEAKTNAALDNFAQNLSKVEASISHQDERTLELFGDLAKQLKQVVDRNRSELAQEISATISRTEAIEQRLDNDISASADDVNAMRAEFETLKSRVTAGEINQAATLSTIGREIDAFTEKFETRLSSAEEGLTKSSGHATNGLRGELVEFSKAIQERLNTLEAGFKDQSGRSVADSRIMREQLQKLEDGFAARLSETEQLSQRSIEHIGQQVAAASARAQQRQDDAMGQFDGRLGAIEQKTEDRLSSALSNISDRLEQIQTQTSATTAPIQKSLNELSQRVDSIEDFKLPSHENSVPPVQTVNAAPIGASGALKTGADIRQAAGFGPNIANSSGPNAMSQMPPPSAFGAGAQFGVAATASTGAVNAMSASSEPQLSSSGTDLRQQFAPNNSGRSQSFLSGEQVKPQNASSDSYNETQPAEKRQSTFRQVVPYAFVGMIGLTAASFMLRGKSPAPSPYTGVNTSDYAANQDRNVRQPTYASRAGVAEDDGLMDAYEIQINKAHVGASGGQLQPQLVEAPAVEYAAPKPFSALATLSTIEYSKPMSVEQAAASGNAEAQLIVAQKRAKKGDAAGAVDMLKKASAQGQGMAHYLLAQIYDLGKGVEKTPDLAFTHTKAAAEAGNIQAMHDYGAYLHEGKFVAQDNAAAAKWFKQAAEFGVVDSQFNLGLMYLDGIGVTKSPEHAMLWLSLAEKAGDPDAGTILESIQSTLNPTSVSNITANINSWKKMPSKRAANGKLGTEPWNTQAKGTIKDLQKALNIMGYDAGTPDGAIGPRTARAIRSFERDNGMGETGRLNEGLIHTVNAKIRDAR